MAEQIQRDSEVAAVAAFSSINRGDSMAGEVGGIVRKGIYVLDGRQSSDFIIYAGELKPFKLPDENKAGGTFTITFTFNPTVSGEAQGTAEAIVKAISERGLE